MPEQVWKECPMKMSFRLSMLAVWLLCSAAVRADSVVTGTLGFTCDNGCQPPHGVFYNTLPTSGSFTYDKTTQQFLSFGFSWDGWNWSEPLSQLTSADYLAMIGKGSFVERYFVECIGGTVNPWPKTSCDDSGAYFQTWRADPTHNSCCFGGGYGTPIAFPGPSAYPIDVANGDIFVTDLDKAVSTPEPPTFALIVGGILYLLLGRRIKAIVKG
jgi:hypothetical protein